MQRLRGFAIDISYVNKYIKFLINSIKTQSYSLIAKLIWAITDDRCHYWEIFLTYKSLSFIHSYYRYITLNREILWGISIVSYITLSIIGILKLTIDQILINHSTLYTLVKKSTIAMFSLTKNVFKNLYIYVFLSFVFSFVTYGLYININCTNWYCKNKRACRWLNHAHHYSR